MARPSPSSLRWSLSALAIATQRVRLSLSIGLGFGALLAAQLDPLAAATRTASFLFHVGA